ncbi:MAG: threonine-phosphate decarboxylase CobD [Pseudomonadota bacterium]
MTNDLLHGGALDHMRKSFPDAPTPWADLSTGINPWPYPHTEISNDCLSRLPSHAAYRTCRQSMAKALGALEDTILLAPGSELLIRLLPTVIQSSKISILSPTYGDHPEVWRWTDAEVIETADPLAMAPSADAIVVCNPNNPDGRKYKPQALEEARQQLARRGGWLIVDEAYGDLDPTHSLAPRGGVDGLVLLRSFGKFFGLAGLRFGALIAPPELVKSIGDLLGAWPVSGPALEIATRAYADTTWQMETRSRLRDASKKLKSLLQAGGLKPVGGTDLFQYIDVDHAHTVWEHLARHGIYVRRFGWSDRYLRVGLPSGSEEEARLAAAVHGLSRGGF